MSYLSVEAVQAMAQKGIECLKFQEKLFRKIAHEHKIRDPQVEEEFDEDYDHVDPHLQAEERVHQQNQPLLQHQPQGPPEDTHAEYQYEEPIATSSSGGPVHPSELSTPFSSAILNMDGVTFEEEKDGRVAGWGFTRPSHTAHRDNNSIRGDPRGGGGEEEEEVDMEGGGHVTPDGPRRTTRVSRPPHCGTGGHLQKKHGTLTTRRSFMLQGVELRLGVGVGPEDDIQILPSSSPAAKWSVVREGTVLLLSIPPGITLTDLRQFITNAGRLPSTMMKITYAFPTLSFLHTMYTYVGVEVVNDNGVNIIFDVADGIFGYTPTLYTEVLDDNNFRQEVGGSHCNSLPIHRSTERSRRPHEKDPSKQQYLYDDTCFAGDMHDDSTILEQHNDYVEHDSAFDNNLGDDDDVSQSSKEDVDEGLKAEDHEKHEIPEFEPPSSMFTDDTWTNIVDPSPQMPTKSHIGWDVHCELFKGQVFFSKEEVQNTVKKYTMQQNNVVKTSALSPTTLVYKCKNPVPCQWRLRARKCKDVDEWIISRYAGPHTCVAESVSQDHHNLDARFIYEIIAPIVKKDASIKVKVLQAMILDRPEGFQPSYAKTWAAKQIAIARIFGNWDESYAEVESFLAVVKVKNPGKYKGVILVAVSQDAENQIFPIAFAIVEKEDADN
ncbi:hypothetical protein RHGRI_031340 [Rhododendron griersonianum]|uniref:Transposase MuDR plant domain-containing protein n=1 Tax=Rhododendron griersonianum TaxID=479676 RepID=A0AAV6I7L3_9ERIC|nr:hypothetical protein RHGRI_031340 [Rhododendron griersonianum]